MSSEERTSVVIALGLDYIASEQQPNGGFISQSSPTQTPWQSKYQYHTTFVPALMLGSLSQLEQPAALAIRSKLASFLLTQKSDSWSFNYWERDTPEHKAHPYPDDLDDTFCALTALYLHDAALVDEAALAHMVKLLVATEQQVGGPYRTWLITKDAAPIWRDVDLAVNTNIAYFLSLVSNPLPNLEAYMEQHIVQKDFTSPYYPVAPATWYYLARAYHGSQRPALQQIIEKHWLSTKNPSTLDTALAANALLHLDPDSSLLPDMVTRLYETQQPDGSWPAATFYLDIPQNKQSHYHGSPALTTTFALEALSRYQKNSPHLQVTRSTLAKDMEVMQKRIIAAATKQSANVGSDVKKQLHIMLAKLIQGDTQHEITLLPYIFAQSLAHTSTLHLHEQRYIHLGLANLYGWIAYTIYDDFLDDEGQPALLSAANVALRSSLLQFQQALPDNPDFQALVVRTFNTIDNANTWEVTQCRFTVTQRSIVLEALPHFGQRRKLAERSLGHGLTPLAVLAAQGVSLDDPGLQAVSQAFQQYLIARQLNDDAHDWKEDVQKGHITYVVATILKELGTKGEQSFTELLPAMERQFWHHTLTQICKDMQTHLRRGRKLLVNNPHLHDKNLILSLLEKTENSVKETLATQKKTKGFLQNYRGKKANS